MTAILASLGSTWLAVLLQSPNDVQNFVNSHISVVSVFTITVFGAGCAAGRFAYDRSLDALDRDAQGYKEQRDEARRRLEELKASPPKGYSDRALPPLGGLGPFDKLTLRLGCLFMLAMLAYGIYLQRMSSISLAAESAMNTAFRQNVAEKLACPPFVSKCPPLARGGETVTSQGPRGKKQAGGPPLKH